MHTMLGTVWSSTVSRSIVTARVCKATKIQRFGQTCSRELPVPSDEITGFTAATSVDYRWE